MEREEKRVRRRREQEEEEVVEVDKRKKKKTHLDDLPPREQLVDARAVAAGELGDEGDCVRGQNTVVGRAGGAPADGDAAGGRGHFWGLGRGGREEQRLRRRRR